MMRTILLNLLTWGALMACSKTETPNPPLSQGTQIVVERTIQIVTTKDTLTIEVALADNDQERAAGLMDVRELAPNQGMLFIFPTEEPRAFWMANTPLPLDMLFINEAGEIVRIHRDTQPFSEQQYPSEKPAKYVLEMEGGYCVDHDILEGMNVVI